MGRWTGPWYHGVSAAWQELPPAQAPGINSHPSVASVAPHPWPLCRQNPTPWPLPRGRAPRRNVRWPLLSILVAQCLCILYGIKVQAWGLPAWQNGDDYRMSFQLCSFALSLILSFRIKVVSWKGTFEGCGRQACLCKVRWPPACHDHAHPDYIKGTLRAGL